ncbi:hypothetical protein [Euzebya tangerina]|uniref:hypothetical protein n=1 Tax=Euzebya tangerina TaxID=591198 RepID=UPI000E314189|nr:hypothetical protein [Euzebya tangerina]
MFAVALSVLFIAAIIAIGIWMRRSEASGSYDAGPSSVSQPGVRKLFDFGPKGWSEDGVNQRHDRQPADR